MIATDIKLIKKICRKSENISKACKAYNETVVGYAKISYSTFRRRLIKFCIAIKSQYYSICNGLARLVSQRPNSNTMQKIKKMFSDKFNNTCQCCGGLYPLGAMVIHHIDFNRHNNNMDNYAFICGNCHNIIHAKQYITEVFIG